MNYTEMLFNRDERLVNLLNQADNKNLELVEEIDRLNKGYCPIKEKCNKGECDCTNEEYNQMCEENTKLDLEIERLNNIIKEVREYAQDLRLYDNESLEFKISSELLEILDKVGDDKE